MGKSPQRHIVALGGGGFSMTPDNPLLDAYIVGLARKRTPRVCFIPTASGDAEQYIGNFYQQFSRHHPQCALTHLPLFKQKGDIAETIEQADVLYVGGGNTINMLVLWQQWGVGKLLRRAYENGAILAGMSAGANCWFESFLTDSTGSLTLYDGLGWLPGAFSPHYDSEEGRRPAFQQAIRDGEITAGYACDNDVALHFVNEKLRATLSARGPARAFNLQRGTRANSPVERTIIPTILNPAAVRP